MNLIDSFLSQLDDLGRNFARGEVPKAQLASLVVTPGVKETLCVNGRTEGFPAFAQGKVFELHTLI